jgi:hypothetical protein
VLIRGNCHCQNIRFALHWEPSPDEILARACTCSFCVAHGGVWTSYAAGTLNVSIDDAERVSKYRFGTRTAEFYVCARCGCVPVVCSVIEGRCYAVVNTNTFEREYLALVKAAPVTHEGESGSSRLARRAMNWIGRVEIAIGGT